MSTNCTEVCNKVVQMLSEAGFELSDDDNHNEILYALEECQLVRKVVEDCRMDIGGAYLSDIPVPF